MKRLSLFFFMAVMAFSCADKPTPESENKTMGSDHNADFNWEVDRFADVRVLHYQIPGWEKLSLSQRMYVYHLGEAGYAGRDIMYDSNYRYNLEIRKAFDKIIAKKGSQHSGAEWDAFMEYAKRVYFANGIHHHYSMDKFTPKFSEEYLKDLLAQSGASLSADAISAIMDPSVDNKKVSLDSEKDLVLGSAVNFYGPNVTQADAEKYYSDLAAKGDSVNAISYGLNSRLVKKDGKVMEEVYSLNGKYGAAIKHIISHLNKAIDYAENEPQKKALRLLIKYYETGDLKIWDEYNIAWVEATDGDVDYINGFVEVYNDPLGYKGSYENIVEIKDFDASERMAVLSEEIQWFEDNSPTLPEHKKKNVRGVSYKVVAVAAESGDASPATPIGVNLPNADWIRADHGSKSVSLGNIIEAYDHASGPGLLAEFAHDQEEIDRITKYGGLADKMGTALHEVLGHASGQIEPGVATPKETLKSYASTLEEARADIFALYYIMDQKLIDMGLMPSIEAAKAEYDNYIANGMMKQLRRLEPGAIIEESHMRNRQLIAAWAFEKGNGEVIQKVIRDGKTYFNVVDYEKLRSIFGDLLKEIQRIKSQGDYVAGKALVEDYGVQVDQDIHAEVLRRSSTLSIPPYQGFVNPVLKPVYDDDGKPTDVIVEQPSGFIEQMLDYAERYGHL